MKVSILCHSDFLAIIGVFQSFINLYKYMKSKQFIPAVNDDIFGAYTDYRDLRKLVLNWLKQKNKTNEEFQKV